MGPAPEEVLADIGMSEDSEWLESHSSGRYPRKRGGRHETLSDSENSEE